MNSGAEISRCGGYRYWLRRQAEITAPERNAAFFVMLNPSTADAADDDPTIRRCRGFARGWGCNGLIVANLYAFRSTDPKQLWVVDDPIGPENDHWLRQLAGEHSEVICAWGNNAKPDRVAAFRAQMNELGARLMCLGLTKSGAPRHPLYVRTSQPLIEFPDGRGH